MKKDIGDVKTWLFDMDGVKYDSTKYVIPMFWKTFANYVRDHVPALHGAPLDKTFFSYVKKHGAIHRAMAIEHNVDIPHFLEKIHDFDVSKQQPDPVVTAGMKRLKADKITFTNSPRDFAHRLMTQLELKPLVKDIFALEDMGYDTPKPFLEAYYSVLSTFRLDARKTGFVEDTAPNLEPAHRLGMLTIHIHGDKPPVSAPYIDYSFRTFSDFLAVAAPQPAILPQPMIVINSNKIR